MNWTEKEIEKLYTLHLQQKPAGNIRLFWQAFARAFGPARTQQAVEKKARRLNLRPHLVPPAERTREAHPGKYS